MPIYSPLTFIRHWGGSGIRCEDIGNRSKGKLIPPLIEPTERLIVIVVFRSQKATTG